MIVDRNLLVTVAVISFWMTEDLTKRGQDRLLTGHRTDDLTDTHRTDDLTDRT